MGVSDLKPQRPDTIYPSYPIGIDPQLRKVLQDLWDRMNYFVQIVGAPSAKGSATTLVDQVSKLQVVLQTVQDSLTQQSTFVGFGVSSPVAPTASVSFLASGIGLEIAGSSSAAVISVTSAAATRAAIDAAQRGAPGAHTITLAALTGGGAQGSITWNADGVVTAYVDPI